MFVRHKYAEMNVVTWLLSVPLPCSSRSSPNTCCFSQGGAAKTGYLVPGAGSGQGLGAQNPGSEEGGGRGLDSWVPLEEESIPMRSMTPAKVCSWEGFIITKWP